MCWAVRNVGAQNLVFGGCRELTKISVDNVCKLSHSLMLLLALES